MAKPSGDRIKKEIRRLDKAVKPDSQDFIEACVLLDSAVIGPNADAIAEHLRYSRSAVREIGKRARETGLWVGGKVGAVDWFTKHGAISFWCDCAVLKGLLKRSN